MTKARPFPIKQRELLLFFDKAVAYLEANASRLAITDGRITTLKQELSTWTDDYRHSQNPENRTRAIYSLSMDVNKLKVSLKAAFAEIPEQALTQQDCETLNLAEQKSIPAEVPQPKN